MKLPQKLCEARTTGPRFEAPGRGRNVQMSKKRVTEMTVTFHVDPEQVNP